MAIEWGNIINKHITTKPTININAEDWGYKLLAINWKYILELWTLHNEEVKGSTPEEQNSSFRQDTISEIQYLQAKYSELPFDLSLFINNDRVTLESMTTNALIAYLYGAKLIIRAHCLKLALARKIIRRRTRSRPPPRNQQVLRDKSELDPGE
jgi:hypothetical protein